MEAGHCIKWTNMCSGHQMLSLCKWCRGCPLSISYLLLEMVYWGNSLICQEVDSSLVYHSSLPAHTFLGT